MRGDVLSDTTGEPLAIAFLTESQSQQRTLLPYVNALTILGIQASIRMIDGTGFAHLRAIGDYDAMLLPGFIDMPRRGNCGPIFIPRPPVGTIQALTIRSLMRWSTLRWRRQILVDSSRLCDRSIACCYGIIIRSRWMPEKTPVSFIGTNSVVRNCLMRCTRRPSRMAGGSMKIKQPALSLISNSVWQ